MSTPARFFHTNLAQIKVSSFLNKLNAFAYLALAILILIITYVELRQFALGEAESKAHIILDRNLATHAYFNGSLKPAIFSVTDQRLPAGYFDPTWMSSTYAVREIDQLFQEGTNFNGYYYKEAAINARNPQNEADADERAFLEELNRRPDLQRNSQVRVVDGVPSLVLMLRGETMLESCLRCHSTPDQAPAGLVSKYGGTRSFGRSAGEVVSAISIRIPLGVAYSRANLAIGRIAALTLALLLGLYLAQRFLISRLVLQPLALFRVKALEIAEDEHRLGEQIVLPFGRELLDLAGAFNKLSLNLRAHQNMLEARIQERTVEVEESRHLIQNILDLTPSSLCVLDVRRNQFIYANQQVLSFFGTSFTSFIRMRMAFPTEYVHPEDQPIYEAMYAQMRASQDNALQSGQLRIRNHDNQWRWIALRMIPVERGEDGTPVLILFMGDDITEAHYEAERLRYTSSHDALTGLYNWAFFQESLENLRQNHGALVGFPVGLVMMDVDNLKVINDSIGHAEGDRLLRGIGGTLLTVFRSSDIVARVGGDEFAALLPNFQEDDAQQMIASIRKRLKEATLVSGMPLDVISIGFAVAASPQTLDAARHTADQNMYANKQARKGMQAGAER